MDGIGQRGVALGNAVADAHTPTLDRLYAACPHMLLKAHGTAVGLPSDDDMGNSEVGHNALGAGRSSTRVPSWSTRPSRAARLFAGPAWGEVVANARRRRRHAALHRPALRRQRPLPHRAPQGDDRRGARGRRARAYASTRCSTAATCRRPRRSITSLPFEEFLAELRAESGFDARIACGGGRMDITMDRYEADWDIVERGWARARAGRGTAVRTAQRRRSGNCARSIRASATSTCRRS